MIDRSTFPPPPPPLVTLVVLATLLLVVLAAPELVVTKAEFWIEPACVGSATIVMLALWPAASVPMLSVTTPLDCETLPNVEPPLAELEET
ncbi:MAG TPA: hypothetical protein VGN42_20570 [Pirellulales bacterium]|nr:hypothetical protein [Pirellulales bacterium]